LRRDALPAATKLVQTVIPIRRLRSSASTAANESARLPNPSTCAMLLWLRSASLRALGAAQDRALRRKESPPRWSISWKRFGPACRANAAANPRASQQAGPQELRRSVDDRPRDTRRLGRSLHAFRSRRPRNRCTARARVGVQNVSLLFERDRSFRLHRYFNSVELGTFLCLF